MERDKLNLWIEEKQRFQYDFADEIIERLEIGFAGVRGKLHFILKGDWIRKVYSQRLRSNLYS